MKTKNRGMGQKKEIWMKETGFIRSIEGNQLVINCSLVNYRLRMLEFNRIPGLLPVTVQENDGQMQLCYDITSRETLGNAAASGTLVMEDVRGFMYSLSHTVRGLEDYLLVPDDLVLDKDHIYVCGSCRDPAFCYLPGYETDFPSGLSSLLQDILGMVDHNDHDAVVLAYSLYQESLKPGYVLDDLLKILGGGYSRKREASRDPGDKKERSSDDVYAAYDMPPSLPAQKPAAESTDAMYAAVSRPRRRRALIFGR